jgi:hypothetical protein
VRHGDGGEDSSERSPYRAHFTQTVRAGRVHNHGRRKAVECERDVSAGVSVQAACDVPERASEHDAEEKVG